MLLEVGGRVLTADDHPAAVHLELHELGIGSTQQLVVREHAAFPRELEVMVVVRVLQSGALGLLADAVREVSRALRVLERHRGKRRRTWSVGGARASGSGSRGPVPGRSVALTA